MFVIRAITPLGVFTSIPEDSTWDEECEFLKKLISEENTLMFNTDDGARVFLPSALLTQSVLRLIEVSAVAEDDATDDNSPADGE